MNADNKDKKEAQDTPKDEKAQDAKAPEAAAEVKEGEAKEAEKTKEAKDTADTKDTADAKETAGAKDTAEAKDTKDTKETAAAKETADAKDTKETAAAKETADAKDTKETAAAKPAKAPKDTAAAKETAKEAKEKKPQVPYAVFVSGGKQHIARMGESLLVDRLAANVGDKVDFPEVALLSNQGKVEIGTPYISGKGVSAEVVEHGRGEKIRVISFKRRKHHLKRYTARRSYTKIKISSIGI